VFVEQDFGRWRNNWSPNRWWVIHFPLFDINLGNIKLYWKIENHFKVLLWNTSTKVIREVTGKNGRRFSVAGQFNSKSHSLIYIFKTSISIKIELLIFSASIWKGNFQIWVKEPVSKDLLEMIQSESAKVLFRYSIGNNRNHEFSDSRPGKLRDFVSHRWL